MNMNTALIRTMMLTGIVAVLAEGCVERQVVYVPTSQGQSAAVYQAQPTTNAPNGTVIVAQTPPPPQIEVIPVAPGPDYVWIPGYWGWNGGAWIWISGRWVVRPWHGAVWVDGHWARRGHGSIWIGGHWR